MEGHLRIQRDGNYVELYFTGVEYADETIVFKYKFDCDNPNDYEVLQKFYYGYSYRHYWHNYIIFMPGIIKHDGDCDILPHGFWFDYFRSIFVDGQQYHVSTKVKMYQEGSRMQVGVNNYGAPYLQMSNFSQGDISHIGDITLTCDGKDVDIDDDEITKWKFCGAHRI